MAGGFAGRRLMLYAPQFRFCHFRLYLFLRSIVFILHFIVLLQLMWPSKINMELDLSNLFFNSNSTLHGSLCPLHFCFYDNLLHVQDSQILDTSSLVKANIFNQLKFWLI